MFCLLLGLKCHVICWVLLDYVRFLLRCFWRSDFVIGPPNLTTSSLRLLERVVERRSLAFTRDMHSFQTALSLLLPVKGVPLKG